MRLTERGDMSMVHDEEICRLFHGVLSVRREADGSYFPLRLMPEQLAATGGIPPAAIPTRRRESN